MTEGEGRHQQPVCVCVLAHGTCKMQMCCQPETAALRSHQIRPASVFFAFVYAANTRILTYLLIKMFLFFFFLQHSLTLQIIMVNMPLPWPMLYRTDFLLVTPTVPDIYFQKSSNNNSELCVGVVMSVRTLRTLDSTNVCRTHGADFGVSLPGDGVEGGGGGCCRGALLDFFYHFLHVSVSDPYGGNPKGSCTSKLCLIISFYLDPCRGCYRCHRRE